MSRVGAKPIEIPKNVKLALVNDQISVEGPKGKLSFHFHPRITPTVKDSTLTFARPTNQKMDKALHGTTRSVVANMIQGVTDGFSKELLIEGVGFKAAMQGKQLNLSLGFTHPILLDVPEGLTVEIPKPTIVVVKGVDKVKVGHFSAKIREKFVAEPYKGKGVRYSDEVVRRKAGKTVTK